MADRRSYELFARAGDAVLAHQPLDPGETAAVSAELELAARLREAARAGIPDPAFVDGLRAELRLRFSGSHWRPASVELRYSTVDSALGQLALAYRAGRVVYCAALETGRAIAGAGSHVPKLGQAAVRPAVVAFERAVAQALGSWPVREAAPARELEQAVRDHLAGRRRFKDVDLSALTPFQQRVLEKTAEIPRGEVRPYAWIAREIGAPGATRAVGTALGHNPIPFLIPCHRVVRSDGNLGEYSGGGPAVKQRVLEFEGAPVEAILRAAGTRERLRGSRSTRVVCYPSCHAARRIEPENVVPLASLRQAQAAGYRPCSLCRPA